MRNGLKDRGSQAVRFALAARGTAVQCCPDKGEPKMMK